MTRVLYVDYSFCTGCHACEVACQNEHGYAPEDMGVVVEKIGPFQLSAKKWQYEFLPALTDLCDGCASRVSKGKRPACAQHCQTQCMEFGDSSEFVDRLDGKRILFTVTNWQ